MLLKLTDLYLTGKIFKRACCMLSNFGKSGNLDRLTYFGAPALVSFSHTLIDLSLEDEMKTFVLFVSKAFISSILPMWATKDLQKEAQCNILETHNMPGV